MYTEERLSTALDLVSIHQQPTNDSPVRLDGNRKKSGPRFGGETSPTSAMETVDSGLSSSRKVGQNRMLLRLPIASGYSVYIHNSLDRISR